MGQTFEIEILMDLHVLRSPESENHIFSGWSMCTCVCYQHNSKIIQQKLQIWYSTFVSRTDAT